LYIDKKRSHVITTGERVQFPNSISKNDFDTNIANFWGKVKWTNASPLDRLDMTSVGEFKNNAFADALNKAGINKKSFSFSDNKPLTKKAESYYQTLYPYI